MSAAERTEQEIVKAILLGDNEAIESLLVDVFGGRLRYLSGQYGYEEDELLQALFLHLWRDDWRVLRTWQGTSSLTTWLNVVATRLCLDHRRKLMKDRRLIHRLSERDGAPKAGAASPQELELDRKVTAAEVLNAVDKLPSEDQKLLITLCFLEAHSVGEAALIMNILPSNASVIKHRALQKLRELLEGGLDHV